MPKSLQSGERPELPGDEQRVQLGRRPESAADSRSNLGVMALKEEGHRLIITVIGKDRVGIIAAISAILADANINILDISQTIMQEIFTMIMIVDARESRVDVATLSSRLAEKGKELGLVITTQHEDVFRFMHRI